MFVYLICVMKSFLFLGACLFLLDLRSKNDVILLVCVSASEKLSYETDKRDICVPEHDGLTHR